MSQKLDRYFSRASSSTASLNTDEDIVDEFARRHPRRLKLFIAIKLLLASYSFDCWQDNYRVHFPEMSH